MTAVASKQIVIKQPTHPATEPQKAYIRTLAAQRPAWKDYTDRITMIISTVLMDEDVVSKGDASLAIERLLSIKPAVAITKIDHAKATVTNTLIDLNLPESRYALPRVDGTGWDFFQVCKSKKTGNYYVVQLLGSPGDWHRKWLTPSLQVLAAKHIAEAPKESAIQYAKQHGRCAVCDAHLSDPISIAQSVGPVCKKRFA